MKTIAAMTLLSLALLYVPTAQAAIIDTFGTGTNTFTMTFEPIGNPGNAADTTGSPNPAGSVGYAYNMGKYEVSRDMINKANAVGNLGITLQDMTSSGGNGANRPATGVSWNEAARYVNWLNMSQGYSPAYKFATQPGEAGYTSNAQIQLWQLGDAGYNAANEFRNSQAKYFLPSMDECTRRPTTTRMLMAARAATGTSLPAATRHQPQSMAAWRPARRFTASPVVKAQRTSPTRVA